MGTTTTERQRAPTTSVKEDTGTATLPDLWDVPGSGIAWCDGGDNHGPARADVADLYLAAGQRAGKRVRHRTVVRVTQELWQYLWVCRFFHLRGGGRCARRLGCRPAVVPAGPGDRHHRAVHAELAGVPGGGVRGLHGLDGVGRRLLGDSSSDEWRPRSHGLLRAAPRTASIAR